MLLSSIENKLYCGIDTAKSNTGIVLIDKNYKIIQSRTIKINSKIERVQYWGQFLFDNIKLILDLYKPLHITIEDNYYSRSVKTVQALSQALACTRLACNDYDYSIRLPSQARKLAFDKDCKKEEIPKLLKKYDIDASLYDEHICDAIVLAISSII